MSADQSYRPPTFASAQIVLPDTSVMMFDFVMMHDKADEHGRELMIVASMVHSRKIGQNGAMLLDMTTMLPAIQGGGVPFSDLWKAMHEAACTAIKEL